MISDLSVLQLLVLLVDAGLVVLIWMIQIIIYPAFLFYEKEDLINWHNSYTIRIAVIVIPLMAMQLVFSILDVYIQINLATLIPLFLVLFLWVFTFSSFAPLHFKITSAKADKQLLCTLVKRNWIRTFLRSFLFLYHLCFLL